MADFETLLYEERNGVAWVTLNRPEVNNAFDPRMRAELRSLWYSLRRNDDVRCVVLTGAGEKAFCTGIDRDIIDDWSGLPNNPWKFADEIAEDIGPKTNHLWTPVIAAVNGMACGGAFYFLGESEFVIASETATFFDPHVSYGMVAGYESIQLLQKAPFHEVMRMAIMGNNERMSAKRAHEIGLVSEVVPPDQLTEAVTWAAEIDRRPVAGRGAGHRAGDCGWGSTSPADAALDLAPVVVRLGTKNDTIFEGQATFRGERPKYRVR